MSQKQIREQLESIIAKYEKYQNWTPDKPPKNSNMWYPKYGFLKLEIDTIHKNMYFTEKVTLGVKIGSSFANDDQKIIQELRSEILQVLEEAIKNEGGHLVKIPGSAYSVIGWST